MRWLLLVCLVACGTAPPPQPQPPPKPVVDPSAEIVALGNAWRAAPADPAPLAKLVELARSSGHWRPAVPYIAESLATTDVAIDGAFDAVIALGPTDPKVTAALLTPLAPRRWNTSKIPYERYAKAHDRAGRALIPAYLAAATLEDVPEVRERALDWLGRWRVREARPLFLAVLQTDPFLTKDASGGMSDPRGMYHLDALEGLTALGPDPEVANAMFDYAFDPRMRDGDAHTALDDLLEVMITPTPAQLAKLLEHAIDPDEFSDAEKCGNVYAMLVTTPAELAQLARAPAPNGPYFSGYAGHIEQLKPVFACSGSRPCLIALLGTHAFRNYERVMLDRVAHDLARRPAQDVVPTLLATVDEISARPETYKFEQVATWIARLVPGPCPRCIAHLEAGFARFNVSDRQYMSATTSALDELRARQPSGATLPTAAPVRDAFAAISDLEQGAFRSGTWDPTLFAPTAFAIGRGAMEVGVGADHAAAFAAHDFDGKDRYEGVIRSLRGVRGHVMWDTARMRFARGGYVYVSQLVVEDNGAYQVRAWSAASEVADKAKRVPVPAPIADVHGDPELEAVARRVFGSRTAWIAAMSERDDAFSIGNTTDDEWTGPAGKVTFKKFRGAFKVRDGIHVEKVTDDVGFAAANIDLLGMSFRVLAVFVKEASGWTIIQSHWSLAAPPA